jgi:TPR repeat protein
MGTSVLHIKTEVECQVYLFDEEKGIAKPGTYFNLEVRKGEQDLLFVSTEDETVRCHTLYEVEENDSDYRMTLERSHFKQYPKELLDNIKLVEQGDAEAQFRLGKRYYNGDDVEQDYEEAVKWYRKAAEQRYAAAQFCLGVCFANGWGVGQDYTEAVRWYRKAAEQGDSSAQNNLGVCYTKGQGLERNYAEARRWFRKAMELGNDKARINLGKLLYNEGMFFFGADDLILAVESWKDAAEIGYAAAQNELGYCYERGEGVEQNSAEALKWYSEAANQGYAESQYHLGWLYSNGKSSKQDYLEAVKWWSKAAEQDDVYSQFHLGECYYYGRGVDLDYEEAVKWWSKAAEQDDVYSQFHLGECYYYGRGVNLDYDEAVKLWYKVVEHKKNNYLDLSRWREDSEEQLYIAAQIKLGECYYYGRGVERDYVEAIRWFRIVADQEDDAKFYLGMCYYNCQVVEKTISRLYIGSNVFWI